jgi:two-component system cell cycle response regulator
MASDNGLCSVVKGSRRSLYNRPYSGAACFAAAIKWGSLLEKDKIVVADDSRVYRRLVQNALANENYELLFAKDGGEALSLVGEHCPLILITDWEMPDATGVELCKQIRCDKTSNYVYVILLTSNSEKAQIVQGLASGADDYLTKPFDAGELLARVGVGRRLALLQRELKTKTLLLEELALTDELTGLPNRRAVEKWAERELKAAARYRYPIWFVMMDLDHFKAINDRFGHPAGDIVLRRVAQILQVNTRASNLCGRFGGEEFILILTRGESDGVLTAVERLKDTLEKENFTLAGESVTVTASFGVAGPSCSDSATDLDELIQKADAALYAAKQLGRNRIKFAG